MTLNGNPDLQREREGALEFATIELKAAGFRILDRIEDFTTTRIFDVGAIVYYLKAISFEFPDFTVEKYYDKLVEINQHINDNGYLDLPRNNHRYFIKAKKT